LTLRACPFSTLVAVLVSYVLMVWGPLRPADDVADASAACWADQAADEPSGSQAGGWLPGGIDG
jgi:hypothetical protein